MSDTEKDWSEKKYRTMHAPRHYNLEDAQKVADAAEDFEYELLEDERGHHQTAAVRGTNIEALSSLAKIIEGDDEFFRHCDVTLDSDRGVITIRRDDTVQQCGRDLIPEIENAVEACVHKIESKDKKSNPPKGRA